MPDESPAQTLARLSMLEKMVYDGDLFERHHLVWLCSLARRAATLEAELGEAKRQTKIAREKLGVQEPINRDLRAEMEFYKGRLLEAETDRDEWKARAYSYDNKR